MRLVSRLAAVGNSWQAPGRDERALSDCCCAGIVVCYPRLVYGAVNQVTSGCLLAISDYSKCTVVLRTIAFEARSAVVCKSTYQAQCTDLCLKSRRRVRRGYID